MSSSDWTLGSFAVVYHRTVFEEIVDWLDNGPMQPFDYVFGYLAKKGYPTRTANPSLVIADVNPISDVSGQRRRKKIRWRQDRPGRILI